MYEYIQGCSMQSFYQLETCYLGEESWLHGHHGPLLHFHSSGELPRMSGTTELVRSEHAEAGPREIALPYVLQLQNPIPWLIHTI